MDRFAITATSLIAATVSIGGCEQEPNRQPDPEALATVAVPAPEPERTEYSTLLELCESGDATPERVQEFLDLRVDVNAKSEEGATPLMIGLALGIYGLTQAIFQIPFGMLSDRWGRKPLIIFGLLIFAGGSVVAALAESVEGIIIGRALQGSGAIAAVVLALVADLTREQQRTKAMALLGMSIGASFLFALMARPYRAHWIGLSGIIWLPA